MFGSKSKKSNVNSIKHMLGDVALTRREDFPIRSIICGAPGSGKSSLIKRLTRRFTEDGITSYVMDNTGDAAEYYRQFSPPGTKINVVSPEFLDGVGINFAEMITTASDRMQLVNKLAPDAKGDANPFFTRMVRVILRDVIMALHRLAKENTVLFADIIRVSCNAQLTSELTKMAGIGNPYARFGDDESKTKRDIEVSILSVLADLGIFAAVDMHCTKRISLPSPEKGSITVFEWSDDFTASLASIYPFLFDYMSTKILKNRDEENHTAFVIDEFRLFDRPLDCIHQLAAKGRKGMISVILSLHEVNGLFSTYTKDRAIELVGLMTHRVFLRVGSPDMAKFCSDYLGNPEIFESIPSSKADSPAHRSIKQRLNVLPDELRLMLPMPSWEKDCIKGYIDYPSGVAEMKSTFRDDVQLKEKAAEREARPSDHQELPRMSKKDIDRMGIPFTDEIREALEN